MRIHLPFAAALLATTALTAPAYAACTASADNLTLSCSGTLAVGSGLPITIYDAAAGYQPTAGSNSYTPANPAFPAASNPNNPGYNPNPPTTSVNFDSTTVINAVNPSTSAFADKGLITANFSNSESIDGSGVNNVIVNNAGTLGFSTNQIATSRLELINSDSQVASFTVNNTGKLSVTQTYFTSFSAANLSVTSSGSPATYSAKYSGGTLNDMSALYADDNTNEFTLNNAKGASALATGNFANIYYGRADTTVTNSGTIANTSWAPTDTIANGHWALVAWAGTDYNVAPNTNPDSDIVIPNANGSVTVLDTSALTITNNAGATIKGDIIAMDITPLVYAAAVGASANPFANLTSTTVLNLPVSSSNAGPRDSNIQNNGSIGGNAYLGSGTHVIDNAAGASWTGSVYVDQRPFQVIFSEPNVSSVTNGVTYYVNNPGSTDNNGTSCGTAATTTDAGCATTAKHLATVVGGQSLTFTNEGVFNGDIAIYDQATSVNSVTLTGTGFTGNVIAVNGTGSNSLNLSGVTNLASVYGFNNINLGSTQVTVAANATTATLASALKLPLGGVTMPANSTLATTITGIGSTASAPNTTNIGNIAGTLTLQGATTLTPTVTGAVRNGDVYQVASTVTGAGASQITVTGNGSALVSFTADTSTGALLLDSSVVSASSIPGLSRAGAATLNNLLSYGGGNANVQSLVTAVESLTSLSDVAAAAEKLRPAVNGASIQTPLAMDNTFSEHIASRVDASVFGALSDGPADFVASASPIYKGPSSPAKEEGAWITAAASSLTQNSKAGIAGYNAAFGGFMAGYDHLFAPGARVGAAVGFAAGNAPTAAPGTGSLKVQNVEGLVYGTLVQGAWYAKGDFGVGGLNYRSNRGVSFTGFYDDLMGHRSGLLFSSRVETGHAYVTPFGTLIPLVALSYAHIDQSAYTESGFAGAALSVAQQSTDSLQSGVGAKAVLPLPIDSAFAAALELRAIWRHEFLNTAEVVTANFAGGTTFQAGGPSPAKDLADVGATLRMALPSEGASFELGYNGRIGSGFAEHTGLLRVRYDF